MGSEEDKFISILGIEDGAGLPPNSKQGITERDFRRRYGSFVVQKIHYMTSVKCSSIP